MWIKRRKRAGGWLLNINYDISPVRVGAIRAQRCQLASRLAHQKGRERAERQFAGQFSSGGERGRGEYNLQYLVRI